MLPEALGSPQLQNSRRMMFLHHLKPLFIVIGIPGTISLQPNCFSFPNGSAVPLDAVLNRLISAVFSVRMYIPWRQDKACFGPHASGQGPAHESDQLS